MRIAITLCAQVSDIAIAVREGADAVMLSGETAYGKFPFKAVDVMSTVAQRTENAMLRFSVRAPCLTGCSLKGACRSSARAGEQQSPLLPDVAG